ncbi:MAG: hypothetical protein J6Q42_00110, partial [Clostridia bacterium]|nr:hypothetical protein [Clostridia bacterium]
AGTFNMLSGGITGEVYTGSGKTSIVEGFFGSDARNSINASWLNDASVWGRNGNSNPVYPSDIYPHIVHQPGTYVLVTDINGTVIT